MMTYRLDIRNDDKWVYAFEHGELALVQACRDRRPAERGDTGHRIYKSDRKRLKNSCELAGAPRAASRRASPGVLDVKQQAKLAAEHLHSTEQKGVHVYPLGKGHAHTSNQFRKFLFCYLTGRTGWFDESDRIKAEAAAERLGYIIIEVNPNDWSTS